MGTERAISATPKVIFAMTGGWQLHGFQVSRPLSAPFRAPARTVVIDSPRRQDGCSPPVLMPHPAVRLLARPLWPDHPRCRHHGWLVHPCDRPRQPVRDSAKSCASRPERSGRPYGLRQRLIRDSAKNSASSQGRSDRPCGRPRRRVGGSARSFFSRPARPYRPCWRSAVAAPRSLTQIRGLKCGRPELVPEPLLLSSTKTISVSLNPASTEVAARAMPRPPPGTNNLWFGKKCERRRKAISSSGLRFRADDPAAPPGRAG